MRATADQVCRARLTFAYTESGPKGLLTGKRAFVVVTSGGTPIGSPDDFATGYLRHVLGFIGITDVTFIAADRLTIDGEAKVEAAHNAVNGLALAAAAEPVA